MTMLLTLVPARANYAEEPRALARMYRVEGGRPRGRLDLDEASSRVSVSWRLRAGPYGLLAAFHRAVTEGPAGPQPFEIDLVLDGPAAARYTAQFVPGSFRLDEIAGGAYSVSAQLEVEPAQADVEFDEILVELFGAYGSAEEANAVLRLLAELANSSIPEALAA